MFRFMKTTVITLATLSLSISAFADNEQVTCPSPNLIRSSWLMLDTVSIMGKQAYAVSSMTMLKDEAHRSWYLVTYAYTDSMDDALRLGVNQVKSISGSKQKFAIDNSDIYYCTYTVPNTKFGVGIISYKNEDSDYFKFTSVDLKLLNQ